MLLLRRCLRVLLVVAVVLTLAPFFSIFDARAAAFQVLALHLAVTNATLAIALLTLRSRFWAAAGVIAALWNFALIWPAVFENTKAMLADRPATGPALTVVSFDLSFDDPNPAKLVAFLGKSHADVIGLAGVTPEAKAALAQLKTAYPYGTDCIGKDRFCELMLLSKLPLRYPFAGKVGAKLTYVASADFDWQGSPVSIAMTHVVTPFVPADWPALVAFIPADDPSPLLAATPPLWQSMQTAAMAAYAHTLGKNQIIMGSFNSAPWSDAQVAFRHATLLSSDGPLVPSWPAAAPMPLRVPIDPVFVGGALVLRNLEAGPELGSDHLPMIAQIAFRATAALAP